MELEITVRDHEKQTEVSKMVCKVARVPRKGGER